MTRPASVAPVASRDGGGGTVGCTGVPTLEFLASDVCCSARGTSGAGETTCVRPTLISPNHWINAACTTGGGAITACGNLEDWVIYAATRGGAATTGDGKAGNLASDAEVTVAASGTVGGFCGHATM